MSTHMWMSSSSHSGVDVAPIPNSDCGGELAHPPSPRPAFSLRNLASFVDLLAAALRRDSDDAESFLNAAASFLETAVPSQIRVNRRRVGWRGASTRIVRLAIALGACRYFVEEGADGTLVAGSSMVCGETMVASGPLSLDLWIDLLAHDLAAYACSSAVVWRAVNRAIAATGDSAAIGSRRAEHTLAAH